jgi:sarcosine oxidase subunit gamma
VVELDRRFPLDDAARPGAAPEGITPQVTLTVRNGVAHVLVLARKERAGDVAAALGVGADPGRATVTDRFVACPTAPGQWAVTADWGDDGGLAAMLHARVGGAGDVSEQSHGRQTVRIAGTAARELLTRVCTLDLHPRVAGAGLCAQTPVAGIAALVHQRDAAPTFDVMVYAGYAEAFWGRLTVNAASFGYVVAVERVGS